MVTFNDIKDIRSYDIFSFVETRRKVLEISKEYPFNFSLEQFKIEYSEYIAEFHEFGIPTVMNMQYPRIKVTLSDEAKREIEDIARQRSFHNPENLPYSAFQIYMADKFVYNKCKEEFISISLDGGVDCVQARKDDYQDYVDINRYMCYNYNEDDTYVHGLINKTDILLDLVDTLDNTEKPKEVYFKPVVFSAETNPIGFKYKTSDDDKDIMDKFWNKKVRKFPKVVLSKPGDDDFEEEFRHVNGCC